MQNVEFYILKKTRKLLNMKIKIFKFLSFLTVAVTISGLRIIKYNFVYCLIGIIDEVDLETKNTVTL